MCPDLTEPPRGVGVFTAVAAASGFGSQLVVLLQAVHRAYALWILTLALWVVLIYVVFTALTVKENKPTLDTGISGGWLVAVVATESVSTLASLLAPLLGGNTDILLFTSLVFWLAGSMLYIWLISLIFYRYTFFKFSPSDFSSPYWINMGAMAISTLAGSLLIENAADAAFLETMIPFLKGFTIFFWATGTWWIPMLLILVGWRHLYIPLRYDPLYWGTVFPLGMYAVCTFEMVRAMSLDFLLPIAHVFVYAALLAWAMTVFGLVHSLVSSLIPALHSAKGH